MFFVDTSQSRFLSFYNTTTLQWLTNEPLTMNNHRYGVNPQVSMQHDGM